VWAQAGGRGLGGRDITTTLCRLYHDTYHHSIISASLLRAFQDKWRFRRCRNATTGDRNVAVSVNMQNARRVTALFAGCSFTGASRHLNTYACCTTLRLRSFSTRHLISLQAHYLYLLHAT